MPLIHIRIPSPIQGLYAFPSYVLATAIQTELQKNFHNYKAAATGSGPLGGRRLGMPRAPWPALLSFSPAPTYTLGRRQKEALDVEFESRLRAPLFVVNPPARPGTRHALGEPRSHSFLCDVYRSPRGGLTTYHGPGQLVLWPVIDMRSSLHRHFSVREYSCLLEETTIAALRHATAVFGRGVEGFSVQGNPGVWVRHRAEDGSKEVRKIASVGIHLRRYITGLGVAINVDTVVQGSEATNPWARIVACGQEDTKMTNVVSEMFGDEPLFSDAQLEPLLRRVMLRLRRAWQTEFAQRLKIRAHAGKSRYWHKDFRTEVFFSRPASEPAICEYEWTTNSSRLGSWSGGDRVLQRSEDPLILVKKSKAADGFDAQGLIYGWANKLIFQNGGYVIAWSYDTKQAGSRLLPVLIDERARDEPDLACFSLPYDDDDLSRGYEDIGYAAAANAINKLAWFIESRAGRSSTFETVAYLGVPDIRYHLMQMAVCKTGHKVLFSSQQNSTDIHVSLMEMTQCRTLLSAAGVHVGDILSARAMAHHVVPGLDELLDKEVQASLFPYTKTYADAALDPYMILHTSGSTGLPKPVEYNHAGVAVMDRHVFLPDTDDKEHVRIFCRPGLGARYLLLSSPYHFMSAVTGPVAMVFGRAVLVTGFRHKAPTPSDIFGILEHSRVSFTCLNPWLMEDVARHQNAASYIKPLTMVGVGGSVLSKFASDVWGRHTRIQNFWGTTETAGPPHYVAPNEDAAYVYIDCQHGGLDFRRVEVDYSEGDVAVPVFESVFVLTEKSAPYSVWHALRGIRLESGPPYPEFHVGDLWTPHPDAGKAAFAWRFVSRKDDVIVLSTGLNLHPGPMERVLAAQRLVRSAIVVGMRRRQPLALIELGEDVTVQDADGLWSQVIAPQNEREVAHGRIGEKHVLLVPAGGFVRTASKGSVVRRKTEEKFAAQIDEIYDRYGDREQDNEKQRYGSVG